MRWRSSPTAFPRRSTATVSCRSPTSHVGTIVRPGRELSRLAECINALRPDAVFFTGDLVNIRAEELDEGALTLLRQIEGPVWSVTGNHDIGTYIKDSVSFPAAAEAREVIARQRSIGWRVLEDTTVYLRRGTDSISLTGISFDPALRDRRHDRDLPAPGIAKAFAGVPDSLYNITLVHLPQLWEQITAMGYGDLTLAGTRPLDAVQNPPVGTRMVARIVDIHALERPLRRGPPYTLY